MSPRSLNRPPLRGRLAGGRPLRRPAAAMLVGAILAAVLLSSTLLLSSTGCQGKPSPYFSSRRPWEAMGAGKLPPDAMVASYIGTEVFTTLPGSPQALDFARPGRELNRLCVYFSDVLAGGELSASKEALAEPSFRAAVQWADRAGLDVHLVFGALEGTRVGLEAGETRERLQTNILELAAAAPAGVTGIQIDIEGLEPRSAAAESLLQLLAGLRQKLPTDKELGVAAPKWAWNGQDTGWQWSEANLVRLAVADYVMIMNYDWGAAVKDQRSYGLLTRDTVDALAPALGKRLVMGLPAYRPTEYHNPAVENVAGGAAGLARATHVDQIGGVAIHWYAAGEAGTLSAAEWDNLRPLLTPTTTFTATFGGPGIDEASALAVADDGGYVLACGTKASDDDDWDVWLLKTDAAGRELWRRTFGGPGDDMPTCVRRTPDGGYIVTGLSYFFAPEGESPGPGQQEAWLLKTDASGNQLWSRTFGGPGRDFAWSAEPTGDGGYIVAGATESSGGSGWDAWLMKTDSSGQEQWSHTFGGPANDTARAVRRTADGGYILAGATQPSGSGGVEGIGDDGWLIKTDASGREQWSRTFGGSGEDWPWDVAVSGDGGYVLAGFTTSSGAGSYDVWLLKADASGNQVWSRTFGGPGYDTASAVRPLGDGGYIVAAVSGTNDGGQGDAWLIRVDAQGRQLWARFFGGPQADRAAAVELTADGGYVVSGATGSFGAGNGDAWLIKTDARGRAAQGP